MSELIAGLISVAGVLAIGYRIGHSKGFHDGRGHVFDEIKDGHLPVCYRRMGHIVGEFKPFFQKPPAPAPAVLDKPSWFVNEAQEPAIAMDQQGLPHEAKVMVKGTHSFPFLNPVGHE